MPHIKPLLAVLILAVVSQAQVISGAALQRVPPANYIKSLPGSTVATCQVTDTASPCNKYVTTYTDQNLLTACSTTGGPASGANCGNPGLVDLDGNYTIFVSLGVYKTCITTPGPNQVINCYIVGTGNGSSVGAGITPNTSVSVNPNALNFGTVQTNPGSPPQLPATITNNGTTSVTVTGVTIPGSDFSAVNPTICNIVLVPGGACVFPIQATPTAATARVATATVTTNAPVDAQNPLTVSLTATGTGSATFPVTLTGFGLGSGTVIDTNNANSLNATFIGGVCSGACSFSYVTGTVVTLTATANNGSTFGIFNGAGLSTSPGTFTVTQAQTISVTFNQTAPQAVVNVFGIDQGIGTVTSDLNDVITGTPVNCTSTAGVMTGKCSATFTQGQTPVFTEAPSGSCTGGSCTFVQWGGAVGIGCTTGTTCKPTVNSNINLSVDFAQPMTGAALALIQKINGGTAGSNNITGVWAQAQNAGDFLYIAIGLGDATTTVSSVTDTSGNTYTQLTNPTCSPQTNTGMTEYIYYAANIATAAAGANTTTIALSASPSFRKIRALEYSGVAASPLDACVAATGSSTTPASGTLTTGFTNDLLIGSDTVANKITATAANYTQEVLDSGGNDTEDRTIATSSTVVGFTPTQGTSGVWTSILAAFKTTGVTNTFVVNVSCPGNGNGTVIGSGLNATCTGGTPGGTFSISVLGGTILTITANPLGGSTFVNYNGAGCGSNPACQSVAITTNTTIGATFNMAGTSTYFLSPSGNDSNTGLDAAHPWLTCAKAFGSSGFVLGTSGTTLTFAASATPYSACTVTRGGPQSNTAIRVALVCASQWTVGGTNCKVPSFMITTANNIDIGAVNKFGFECTGASLSFCVDVNWQCGTNAFCSTGNSIHVFGNYFHDLAQSVGNGCPSAGAIELTNTHGAISPDAQVIGNVVDHFGIYPSPTANQAQGIYVETQNGVVYNNIVTRSCYAGLQYYDQAFGARISNNVFANNTVGMVLYGANGIAGSGSNTVDNNIIVNNVQQAINNHFGGDQSCSAGKPTLFSNNITFGNGSIFASTLSSCATNTNQFSENPTNTFVNYTGDATGNYQLQGSSIAINNGTIQCAAGVVGSCVPAVDIINVKRPQRTNWDIGAFELP